MRETQDSFYPEHLATAIAHREFRNCMHRLLGSVDAPSFIQILEECHIDPMNMIVDLPFLKFKLDKSLSIENAGVLTRRLFDLSSKTPTNRVFSVKRISERGCNYLAIDIVTLALNPEDRVKAHLTRFEYRWLWATRSISPHLTGYRAWRNKILQDETKEAEEMQKRVEEIRRQPEAQSLGDSPGFFCPNPTDENLLTAEEAEEIADVLVAASTRTTEYIQMRPELKHIF